MLRPLISSPLPRLFTARCYSSSYSTFRPAIDPTTPGATPLSGDDDPSPPPTTGERHGIHWAPGASSETGRRHTHKLIEDGCWRLVSDGRGLQRQYVFTRFSGAMKFMTLVAAEAKKKKHHPEWANVYNKVMVRWTTHYPRGLSDKDAILARDCDEICKKVEGGVGLQKSRGRPEMELVVPEKFSPEYKPHEK